MTAAADQILAIDGGTLCGWAVARFSALAIAGQSRGTRRVASGRWDLGLKDGEPYGCRYLRLWKRLDELLKMGIVSPGNLLAYERPGHYKSWNTTLVCYGLAAHIESWAARRGLVAASIPITDLKTAATGRGRATKDEMIEAAEKIFGHTPATGDEADALMVAAVASGMLG